MDKPLSVREYWNEVVVLSRSAAGKALDVKGIVATVATAIMLTVFANVLPLAGTAFDWLKGNLLFVVLFPFASIGVVYLGVFVWGLVSLPAKLHQKQVATIEKLETQLQEKRKARPPIVMPYDDIPYHREIGISIQNPNEDDLEPVVTWGDLIYIKTGQKVQITAEIKMVTNIPPISKTGKPTIFIVAKAEEQAIEFRLSQPYQRGYDYQADKITPYGRGESDYEIQLTVGGKVGNQNVDDASFTRIAHFSKPQHGSVSARWKE